MSIATLSILVLLSIVLIVILTSVTKLNAFASLFIVALLLAMIALPDKDVVEILKEGFGSKIALPHSHAPGSIGRFGNSKREYRHADIVRNTFCHSCVYG